MEVKDRLIVALDVTSRDEALRWAERLREVVGIVKVGAPLFLRCGPPVLDDLVACGVRVFLDLKLHDIPTAVERAMQSIMQHDVTMCTLHLSGGVHMLAAARRMVDAASSSLEREPTRLLGVTLLTSLGSEDLVRMGVGMKPREYVQSLIRVGLDGGVDGFIVPAADLAMVRHETSEHLLVTPGIRPSWSPEPGDQHRTGEPGAAMRAGADYLVVGRPILEADHPRRAAERITRDMEEGLKSG